MSVWLWALVGLAVWIAVVTVAISFGKAASKPWPPYQQKREDDDG